MATISWQTILGVFFLTLVYGAVVAGLAWLLLRAGVTARRVVALGAMIFGLASGLLAAWAWPYDSCVLPNLWAVLLGDALYGWAGSALGNPALLRAPWLYPPVGAILYGALGLVVQVIVNGRRARRLEGSKGHSIGA